MKKRILLLAAMFMLLTLASAGDLEIVAAQETADSLAAKASEALSKKEYERSAELYLAAIKQGAQDANVFYNAACSFALMGKRDEAFQYLAQAINRGFADADNMKQDSDLVGLHADARWQPLVEKCAANFKSQQTFWNNPTLNTPYRENLGEDEKVAGLSKFWAEVKFNFANFDLAPDLNWDALYLAYLPKVRQTKTTLEYYRVLTELCAQLKDGHTNVYPPDELSDEVYARPAIRTRLIENRVLVLSVRDDRLQQEGIQRGLEVLEINGMPVKQYAEQRVKPYQSDSTRQGLEARVYEYSLLSGSSKEPLEITFQDNQGKTFKKTLPRLTSKEWAEKSKALPPSPLMTFKVLPGNIGYVTLNSFQDEKIVAQFAEAFAEIEKTDALILDIRNNGGGSSNIGYKILQCLTDKPFKVSQWKTRNYRPSFRAWGRPEEWHAGAPGEWQPKGDKLYSKPVAVLTSPRTFSAAEDFAVAFDFMKRGKLIGEPTGGSTGQPLLINLPGGGSARICTKRDSYPDGKEFVGVGVQPNILVLPTLADFRADRDTALEAAAAELKKMLRK